jgi:transcriptional regulator with XRE-family HTH domain
MSIGERIKQRRLELGMTQEELAYSTGGKDYKNIWRYENGESKPTVENLLILAKALQTTPNWLLGFNDDLDSGEIELIEIYRSKAPDIQSKLIEIARLV